MQAYSIRKVMNIPEYKIMAVKVMNTDEIHLWIEPYKHKKFVCIGCGQIHNNGYHGKEEVVIRDLPIFDKKTYLHVTKRRYVCPVDKRTHIETIDWVNKWSRCTIRFAKEVTRLTAITTNQEAGWYLGVDDESVYRIDREILEEEYKDKLMPPPAAIQISVDEVSYRKYHRYLTNVVDIDKKLVIWNDKGRKTEVLDRYYAGIGSKACEEIKAVALDGARTYISSTNKYAVNAMIVYDKFHIMQKLNWAVDMTRKYELRKARKENNTDLVTLINCRQRFLSFKNKKNITDTQAQYLKRLCEINEPIYKALLLKESFLKIYDYQKPEDVQDYLEGWFTEAMASGIETFKLIAESFKEKIPYIVNWFRKKISSAISEGINNKIKRLKRMAYGYKDIEYFKLKIHQRCGLLNPRLCPH